MRLGQDTPIVYRSHSHQHRKVQHGSTLDVYDTGCRVILSNLKRYKIGFIHLVLIAIWTQIKLANITPVKLPTIFMTAVRPNTLRLP